MAIPVAILGDAWAIISPLCCSKADEHGFAKLTCAYNKVIVDSSVVDGYFKKKSPLALFSFAFLSFKGISEG